LRSAEIRRRIALTSTTHHHAFQADMYLEGSDQHRGWFQSSLLLSLAGNGAAPFKTVLTHGFMVDADREKISKSKQGGGYEKPQTAEAYVKKWGADVVRLWVASQDFRNDIVVSEERINKVGEPIAASATRCATNSRTSTTSIPRSTPCRRSTHRPGPLDSRRVREDRSGRRRSVRRLVSSTSSIRSSASSSRWSCRRSITTSSRTGCTPTRRIRRAAVRRRPRCTGS
jgi:hypothetical protein